MTEIFVITCKTRDSGTVIVKAFTTLEAAKLYISTRLHSYKYDYCRTTLEDDYSETVPGPS